MSKAICIFERVYFQIKSEGKRNVKQLHFTAWPDFETPENPEELIRFVEIVRQEADLLNRNHQLYPIVVHCRYVYFSRY